MKKKVKIRNGANCIRKVFFTRRFEDKVKRKSMTRQRQHSYAEIALRKRQKEIKAEDTFLPPAFWQYPMLCVRATVARKNCRWS